MLGISRIDNLLLRKGVNFKDILLDVYEEQQGQMVYKNLIVYSAMQICLVDIFKHLEIVPDYVAGFSVGEVIAAYCDGALSLEQTVFCLHYLGDELQNACEENHLDKKGDGFVFMDAVADTSTYTHPVLKFILTFTVLGSSLLFHLEELIPQPKRFSNRHLSSLKVNGYLDLCTANYLLQALLETKPSSTHLPTDTLLLEIGDTKTDHGSYKFTSSELHQGLTPFLELLGGSVLQTQPLPPPTNLPFQTLLGRSRNQPPEPLPESRLPSEQGHAFDFTSHQVEPQRGLVRRFLPTQGRNQERRAHLQLPAERERMELPGGARDRREEPVPRHRISFSGLGNDVDDAGEARHRYRRGVREC